MGTVALIGLPVADAWGMHGDVGAGWWVVMMIGMALFWGALILGSVWLVRDGLERRQRSGHETPLAILDRRFAEGAVSVDEYHERRDVLARGQVLRPDEGVASRESERRTEP